MRTVSKRAGRIESRPAHIQWSVEIRARYAKYVRARHAQDVGPGDTLDVRAGHAFDVGASDTLDVRTSHTFDVGAGDALNVRSGHAFDVRTSYAQRRPRSDECAWRSNRRIIEDRWRIPWRGTQYGNVVSNENARLVYKARHAHKSADWKRIDRLRRLPVYRPNLCTFGPDYRADDRNSRGLCASGDRGRGHHQGSDNGTI